MDRTMFTIHKECVYCLGLSSMCAICPASACMIHYFIENHMFQV